MDNQFSQDSMQEISDKSTINVVTTLSIIGSILGLLGSFFFLFLPKFIEMMENLGGAQDPAAMDQLQQMADNAMPLFAVSLVCSILCLVGAIMMRKFKKQGLPIYLVGEWLPVIAQPIILGTIGNIGGVIFGAAICAVFSFLHIKNRKYYTA
jgi:uncharacterized membrane protein